MANSSTHLYSSQQIKNCEKLAALHLNISEAELMERAGRAAFEALKTHFPKAKRLIFYCGAGNNAGDGYVLAALAYRAGFQVLINQLKAIEKLPPIAKAQALKILDLDIPIQSIEEMAETEFEADLIIDALLGTGLKGLVKEPMLSAINQMNESKLPVFSLDIPSGLDADTGIVWGAAVKAEATITFIAYKHGLFCNEGPDLCGKILYHSLNLDGLLPSNPVATILNPKPLKKRPKNCHKGDFGRVLVIGGNEGMPGAPLLAAKAAYRVGAGLVTIATRSKRESDYLPEALIYEIDKASDLDPLLEKSSVCLIGPGLGLDTWAKSLFLKVMASSLPMVIDASALRLLALDPQSDDNWVLTPHIGEAAALLQRPTNEISENRLEALLDLQDQYGGTIVLKGVGSLIRTDEPQTYLSALGNPGMASAGMGDVLSGMIAGLLAQKLSFTEATTLAVHYHAKAGDLAAMKRGERGLMASDLMPFIRQLVNE